MKKTDQNREIVLTELRKIPIIEVVCQKVDISRMTFYRWKKEDAEFGKKVDEAILEGRLLVNDLAESQLIGAIKDRNLPAVTYWLKHHHPSYANRLEVTAKIKEELEPLTPEQQETVKQALRMASLSGIYPNNPNFYDESNSHDNSAPTGPDTANAQGPESKDGNGA